MSRRTPKKVAGIRQHGQGWQARISRRGYPDLAKTFPTLDEAKTWRTVTLGQLAAGTWRDSRLSESTPLGDAIEWYVNEIVPTKSPSGQKTEQGRLRWWRDQDIARMPLVSIRGADVSRAIKPLVAYRSANTVRLYLAVLSHLFSVCRRDWGMENLENPVVLARRPKLPPGRDRRLSEDEYRRLLLAARAAKNPDFFALFVLSIEVATRRSELLNLSWADVDFESCTALLRATKNGRDRRVPLSPAAVSALREVWGRRDAVADQRGGRVFGYTRDGFAATWRKIRDRALGPDSGLRFHDLRHEGASRLMELGFNLVEIASVTGHASMQMLKRYSHPRAEDLALRMRKP